MATKTESVGKSPQGETAPKIHVKIAPSDIGEVRTVEAEEIVNAGWSDHPGTGHAILLPDERGNPAYEVLNPMPFAPPIGHQPTPPIEQLIRERVFAEITRLKGEDEIDTAEDQDDFDIPDELPDLSTIYEVIAMEAEAPKIPEKKEPDMDARAKADVDYFEALERERLLRKRHREAHLQKQKEEYDLLSKVSEG